MQMEKPGGVSFAAAPPAPQAMGYGTDPNLAGYYKPGDFWPLTFTAEQRRAATALADVILPADKLGPVASELRVQDFVDEWISAPYPDQVKDREVVLPGLKWLDDESRARFNRGFADLADAQKTAICDDICWPEDAAQKFKKAASFFQKFRSLAAGAYYSTEPGWAAIGYVGNVPMLQFDGPPKEVLERLGVEQTVRP
ncbi:MAG: gluconate 2-dehydrogenase subunit 3 family protein [Verrucomicrobiae bacterium]|nr:gluconate 2-dehydrogenase subunit 3 family protein [Verrucomicrobiae bacterium]